MIKGPYLSLQISEAPNGRTDGFRSIESSWAFVNNEEDIVLDIKYEPKLIIF